MNLVALFQFAMIAAQLEGHGDSLLSRLPQDPDEARDNISAGHFRTVSIGEINGQPLINNSSIGAYATVLRVREDIYDRWGRSRVSAYRSVIKAMLMLYRSLRIRIRPSKMLRDE